MDNKCGAGALTRSLLVALLTGVSSLALSDPAEAQSQQNAQSSRDQLVAYNIAPQPLSSALNEYARQSGLRALYSYEHVRGLQAPAVRGSLTREEALRQLLAPSGYSARIGDDNTLELDSSARPQPAGAEAPAQSTGLQGIRAQNSRNELAALVNAEEDEEEIVVVGTNIRGVYPSSSPVAVYTAEDIARSGAATTEQFIGKLPQNFGTVSPFGSGSAARESVSGIDLRGLGVGTTLVLVNGRRLSLANNGRTADVSMIPASAIDRVELLTDGASAIYGSDAIGGVVNFVLRDDFEGAETRLTYGGVSRGSLRQGGLTQTFGRRWEGGNGLVSFDYSSAAALTRADRDYSAQVAPGTLTPHDLRHNLLATFTQDVTDDLILHGDFLLGERTVKSGFSSTLGSANPLAHVLFVDSTDERQNFVGLGVDYEIAASLVASLRASYSANESDRTSLTTFFNNPNAATSVSRISNDHSALDITATLDGSLIELPGGDLQFSIGVGVLNEDYTGQNQRTIVTGSEIGRKTTYGFVELFAPLISPDQNILLARRLELSFAARHTQTEDTSRPSIDRDFGDATDPKVGVLWAPLPALSFRTTYGTSFRAPSLMQIDPVSASQGTLVPNFPLPFPTGSPSTILSLVGVSPDVDAESAETQTFGIDLHPTSRPTFQLELTYYTIDYTDRIDLPDFGLAPFVAPGDFPEILSRQPAAAVVQDLLTRIPITNLTNIDLSDPAAAAAILSANPNFWISDTRYRNLALSRQEGLDISIRDLFDFPWAQVRLSADVTYILDYEKALLASRPPITAVDVAKSPADLRARLSLGISRDDFDGTLGVNYVDDYVNRGNPNSPSPVDSWTTVDLHIGYNFANDGRDRLLNGVRATISVQNMLDEDPPYVLNPFLDERYGFDPQNANPLGRFVTVGLAKTW